MAIERKLDKANQPYIFLDLFGEDSRRLRLEVRCKDHRFSLWVSDSHPDDSDGWQVIVRSIDSLAEIVDVGGKLDGTTPGKLPYWGDGRVKPRELDLTLKGRNIQLTVRKPSSTSGEQVTLSRDSLSAAIIELTSALSKE